MKTNDIDETIFWSLKQTVFSKTCLTTLDFYSVAFLILLTTFFKIILPLRVCSIFPGFLLSKVHFVQVLAFSKVAKIEGKVFVALRASQGD